MLNARPARTRWQDGRQQAAREPLRPRPSRHTCCWYLAPSLGSASKSLMYIKCCTTSNSSHLISLTLSGTSGCSLSRIRGYSLLHSAQPVVQPQALLLQRARFLYQGNSPPCPLLRITRRRQRRRRTRPLLKQIPIAPDPGVQLRTADKA